MSQNATKSAFSFYKWMAGFVAGILVASLVWCLLFGRYRTETHFRDGDRLVKVVRTDRLTGKMEVRVYRVDLATGDLIAIGIPP